METHGPCTLKGPFTRRREWWRAPKRKPAPKAKIGVVPGIRFDLVQRVRREIEAGTYDTPEKFAMALDAMIRREIG